MILTVITLPSSFDSGPTGAVSPTTTKNNGLQRDIVNVPKMDNRLPADAERGGNTSKRLRDLLQKTNTSSWF